MTNLPLLLGHRGARASAGVRENTLPSFDLALEHGCDGFEFDVRLAGDGRMLTCHDPEVGAIRVASAKRDELADLPQLGDVLRRYDRRAFLDIELKVKDLESKVLSALREVPPQNGFVLSSFLPEVVMELKARSAGAPLGIICEDRIQLARWRRLPVEHVMVHESMVDQKLVEEVHEAKRGMFVWTVNQKGSMLRLANWGVDGIISDETQLLVRTLRGSRGRLGRGASRGA
jgi:glycerophosphoryl diester phosphodiesterase